MDADVLAVVTRSHRPLSGATVARLSGRSYARTRSCLHRLVDHGLLLAEDTGSAVLYRLNREHVLAGPVQDAVTATDSVEGRLTDLLGQWSPAPRAVVLFGSWARGHAGPDSDVDLLVVRDDDVDPDGPWGHQVHRTGRAVEALTGNPVQFVQLTREQLVQAVRDEEPLVASLRADGRVLVGPPLRDLLCAGGDA
ncbi:nucleotidyltransferase domain-containing protein [Kineococcus terrestris]|uniref:nucleotidyltransferase domain-containing protein n=1 Tax=Kineococcus terrestris TaxID=2044856 RepID=UPI0034DAE020